MNSFWLKTILFLAIIQQSFLLIIDLKSQLISNDLTLGKISHFNNVPYLLPVISICLGSPLPQCFSLALSTRTTDTLIESINKDPIFNNRFNRTASKTYGRSTPKTSCEFYLFKSSEIYVDAIGVEDVSYLSFNSPSDQKFLFTLIENNRHSSTINLDGILGMKIDKKEKNPTNSFIEHLSQTKQIDKKNFALNWHSNGTATLYLGENYTQVNYCSLLDEQSPFMYWSCQLTKIALGGTSFNVSQNSIEFNSISRVVVAPYNSGLAIIEHIIVLSGNTCRYEDDNEHLIMFCEEKTQVKAFPDLILSMYENQLKLKWDSLFDLHIINETNMYLSSFIVQTDPKRFSWKIGMPGFVDKTIVFDIEGKRLGIISKKGENTIVISITLVIVIMLLVGVVLLFIQMNLKIR